MQKSAKRCCKRNERSFFSFLPLDWLWIIFPLFSRVEKNVKYAVDYLLLRCGNICYLVDEIIDLAFTSGVVFDLVFDVFD